MEGIAARFMGIVHGKSMSTALADLNADYANVLAPFDEGGGYQLAFIYTYDGTLVSTMYGGNQWGIGIRNIAESPLRAWSPNGTVSIAEDINDDDDSVYILHNDIPWWYD